MGLSDELSVEVLGAALPHRAIRSYPALLSTEAEALAWARAGAPDGAVVAAGYQASPRGRAGRLWPPAGDRGVAFSMIVRPQLAAAREGWLYAIAAAGVASATGDDASIAWPDEVYREGELAGAVGVQTALGPHGLQWGVISVLVRDARPSRARALAAVVRAIEETNKRPSGETLDDYSRRCRTLGRHVSARMIPLGPAGPCVSGRAVGLLKDGALLIETSGGRRVPVRPQNLGLLDDETDAYEPGAGRGSSPAASPPGSPPRSTGSSPG